MLLWTGSAQRDPLVTEVARRREVIVMLDAEDLAGAVRKLDRDPDVSQSTVHYYTQAGILPPAIGRGRNSYTPEHLARFRLARRLRHSGLGLADIRKQVSSLSREDLVTALPDLAQGPNQPLRKPARPSRGSAGSAGLNVKVRRAKSTPATPPARDPLVTHALRALPGKLPRTLRFRQGYSLSCPPQASDEVIARLYATIENVLRDDASSITSAG
jgi:DNA-binding transcriptional MerR regulator